MVAFRGTQRRAKRRHIVHAYCAFDVVIGIKHGTATVTDVRACRRCAGDRSLRAPWTFLVDTSNSRCVHANFHNVRAVACVAGSEDALHPSKAIGPVEGYPAASSMATSGLTKVSSRHRKVTDPG